MSWKYEIRYEDDDIDVLSIYFDSFIEFLRFYIKNRKQIIYIKINY